MVKHIHATVDDKVYEELAQAKGKMSWEEFLQKGKEKVEGWHNLWADESPFPQQMKLKLYIISWKTILKTFTEANQHFGEAV